MIATISPRITKVQTITPPAVDVEKSTILSKMLSPATNFIRFDHISVNEGLSSPVITSILQDQVGFLWFGTPDGLNRYDGYSFTTYRHQESDEFSLSNDWITSLAAGKYGSVWIGTRNGGGELLRSSERILYPLSAQSNRFQLSH